MTCSWLLVILLFSFAFLLNGLVSAFWKILFLCPISESISNICRTTQNKPKEWDTMIQMWFVSAVMLVFHSACAHNLFFQRWLYFTYLMRLIISIFCKQCIVCMLAGKAPCLLTRAQLAGIICVASEGILGLWQPHERKEGRIVWQGKPGRWSSGNNNNNKTHNSRQADAELTEKKLQRVLPPFAICHHYFFEGYWLEIIKHYGISIKFALFTWSLGFRIAVDLISGVGGKQKHADLFWFCFFFLQCVFHASLSRKSIHGPVPCWQVNIFSIIMHQVSNLFNHNFYLKQAALWNFYISFEFPNWINGIFGNRV